jgi:hypothetical protein
MLLLALAATLQLSAAAVDADSFKRFSAACQARMAATKCTCLADTLLKTRDGRVVLEMMSLKSLPEAMRQEAFLQMLNRNNMKLSEFSAANRSIVSQIPRIEQDCS